MRKLVSIIDLVLLECKKNKLTKLEIKFVAKKNSFSDNPGITGCLSMRLCYHWNEMVFFYNVASHTALEGTILGEGTITLSREIAPKNYTSKKKYFNH